MTGSLGVINNNIYFTWFAMLLFFSGFCSSYLVDRLDIKLLKKFPEWFLSIMARYVNSETSFIGIFLVIFLFNSISIYIYMSSGIFVVLPFIIAFITGMNVGLTVFIPPRHMAGRYHVRELTGPLQIIRFLFFSTAVLVLEVTVFSLALGMGMSFGVEAMYLPSAAEFSSPILIDLLAARSQAYLLVCVPLLAVSAYMEANIIKGI